MLDVCRYSSVLDGTCVLLSRIGTQVNQRLPAARDALKDVFVSPEIRDYYVSPAFGEYDHRRGHPLKIRYQYPEVRLCRMNFN